MINYDEDFYDNQTEFETQIKSAKIIFKCPKILMHQFAPEYGLKVSAQCCHKLKIGKVTNEFFNELIKKQMEKYLPNEAQQCENIWMEVCLYRIQKEEEKNE